MSAPLPLALRSRFQALLAEGRSARSAASQLKISASTGVRWAQLYHRNGNAAIAPQGRPKGSGKLASFQGFFEELIAQDGDITLFELRDALFAATGTRCHHSSIHAYLVRLGFRYKKNRWSRVSAAAQG